LALPAEREVFERLLALKAVVANVLAMPRRDLLSQVMLKWSFEDKIKFEKDAERQQRDKVEEMKCSGSYDLTTPAERELLSMNSCNLDEESYFEAARKLECVAVLMWAVSLMAEMPGIDREADQGLLKRIPDNGSTIPAALQLRDREEIAVARDDIERWHWRSRTWSVVERGVEYCPDRTGLQLGWRSYDDMVRAVSRQYFEGGFICEIKDDDFVVKGTPFRNLRYEAWRDVETRIDQRHRALNWLCGYAPENRWDDTPTGK
jgi:hypothetical protein